MSVGASSQRRYRSSKQSRARSQHPLWRLFVRHLPAWVLLAAVMVILLPNLLTVTVSTAGDVLGRLPVWISGLFRGPSRIAPLFTPEIQHWAGDIGRWADEHDLDPNLLATVMQIESCGHPTISSTAGAQGLFQVMPFHFSADENQLDPNINARRGADFLNYCLAEAGGDTGLALACYNGGPIIFGQQPVQWNEQVQRYYRWGTGILGDASANQSRSETLSAWLNAGGGGLCDLAAAALGIG